MRSGRKVFVEMSECEVCKKTFTQRTNRNRHRRQFHTKDSPDGEFISVLRDPNIIQNDRCKQNLSSRPYPLTARIGMKYDQSRITF